MTVLTRALRKIHSLPKNQVFYLRFVWESGNFWRTNSTIGEGPIPVLQTQTPYGISVISPVAIFFIFTAFSSTPMYIILLFFIIFIILLFFIIFII